MKAIIDVVQHIVLPAIAFTGQDESSESIDPGKISYNIGFDGFILRIRILENKLDIIVCQIQGNKKYK